MKRIIQLCFMVLLLFCVLLNTSQIDAKKKVAKENYVNAEICNGSCSDGNKIYYSALNEIYCVNKNGKGHKLVISEKKVETFHCINIYKGYIYCIADFAHGPGVTNEKLIKIKLDGSDIKVLDTATKVMIVNNTIYYIKGKHIAENGDEYMNNVGIYTMNLNGKKRRELVKSETVSLLGCIGKKMYYTVNYKLYESDLNASEASRRYITEDDYIVGISGDYVYKKLYNETGIDINRINISSGVDEKIMTLGEGVMSIVFDDEYMYYDYGRKINKMNLKSGTIKCIHKKGLYHINDIYDKFLVCTKLLNSFEPSKPNSQIILMKTNGKILKKMTKYFMS